MGLRRHWLLFVNQIPFFFFPMMVKSFFTVLLLAVTLPVSAFDSFWPDLTTSDNWSCFESSHIGANDCVRLFSSNLTNGNYWQNDSSAGNYAGFEFNSYKRIAKYTIINVNNDPTLLMKSWRFQAETGSGWVDLDEQNGFSIQYGKRYDFEILHPVEAKRYRLIVDVAWVDGVLLTDLTMHEGKVDTNVLTIQKPDADAEKILELLNAVNVALGLFSIIFTFLYVWKQSLL